MILVYLDIRTNTNIKEINNLNPNVKYEVYLRITYVPKKNNNNKFHQKLVINK